MSKKKQPTLKPDELASLLEWKAVCERVDRQCAEFKAVLGTDPESPVLSLIYALENKYAKELDRRLDPHGGWLCWYRYDNDMGRKKMVASVGHHKVRPICNLNDLARLIAQSREES